MSKLSRDKGARIEREIVAAHEALGIKSERVPLSGASRYQGNGNVIVCRPITICSAAVVGKIRPTYFTVQAIIDLFSKISPYPLGSCSFCKPSEFCRWWRARRRENPEHLSIIRDLDPHDSFCNYGIGGKNNSSSAARCGVAIYIQALARQDLTFRPINNLRPVKLGAAINFEMISYAIPMNIPNPKQMTIIGYGEYENERELGI